MHLLVLLSVLVHVSGYYSENICKVPNGDAGRCVNIVKCRPLWELYKKKHKSETDHLYIQQSYCGNPATSKLKICCPSISTWHLFEPRPVKYHNTIFDEFDRVTEIVVTSPAVRINDTTKPTEAPAKSTEAVVSLTEAAPRPTQATPRPTQATPRPIEAASRPTEPNPQINQGPPKTNETPPPPVDIVTLPTVAATPVVPIPLSTDTKGSTNKNDKIMIIDEDETCGLDYASGNRIAGGIATDIDQYSWLVLLEYNNNELLCEGSLITSRFVLTAAHCIETSNGRPLNARLGEYNITSHPTDVVEVDGGGLEIFNVTVIRIVNWWSHPEFSKTTFLNDIGLVQLAEAVAFDYLKQIICLPDRDLIPDLARGELLRVAGWGLVDGKNEFPDVKKELLVSYVHRNECEWLNSAIISETQICAGGEEGSGACRRDAGAPLMYRTKRRFYAIGVLSFSPKKCGAINRPSVYTVIFQYLRWISDVVNGRL